MKQRVERAIGDDDDRVIDMPWARLFHAVAQGDGIRLVDQRKAALTQCGQEFLFGEHIVGVADQREGVVGGGKWLRTV